MMKVEHHKKQCDIIIALREAKVNRLSRLNS